MPNNSKRNNSRQQRRKDVAVVARSSRNTTRKPRMASKNGNFRIRHREYITDLNTVVAFAVSTFPVNPGMSQTFPWLSGLAQRFEKYKFHQLRFVYETTTSTTTIGSQLMALDYDAADGPPPSKAAMMSYAGATRSAYWANDSIQLRTDNKNRYVRVAQLDSHLDIKTYDVANFIEGGSGAAAVVQCGELYVEYDVELSIPHLLSVSSLPSVGAAIELYVPPAAHGDIILPFTHIAGTMFPGATLGVSGELTLPRGRYINTFRGITDAPVGTTVLTHSFADSGGGSGVVDTLIDHRGIAVIPESSTPRIGPHIYDVSPPEGESRRQRVSASATTGIIQTGLHWLIRYIGAI